MPEEHKPEPFLMKRLILEITESKHLSRSIKASFLCTIRSTAWGWPSFATHRKSSPTNLSLDSESIYARSRLRDKFADIINDHFAFIAQFSGIELN